MLVKCMVIHCIGPSVKCSFLKRWILDIAFSESSPRYLPEVYIIHMHRDYRYRANYELYTYTYVLLWSGKFNPFLTLNKLFERTDNVCFVCLFFFSVFLIFLHTLRDCVAVIPIMPGEIWDAGQRSAHIDNQSVVLLGVVTLSMRPNTFYQLLRRLLFQN